MGYQAPAVQQMALTLPARAVKERNACMVLQYRVAKRRKCFSKLKCFRRFATRYEKSKACFNALVALACAWLHLRLYVDTP